MLLLPRLKTSELAQNRSSFEVRQNYIESLLCALPALYLPVNVSAMVWGGGHPDCRFICLTEDNLKAKCWPLRLTHRGTHEWTLLTIVHWLLQCLTFGIIILDFFCYKILGERSGELDPGRKPTIVSSGPCHPILEAGCAEKETVWGKFAHKHPGWGLVISRWDSFGWEMEKVDFC